VRVDYKNEGLLEKGQGEYERLISKRLFFLLCIRFYKLLQYSSGIRYEFSERASFDSAWLSLKVFFQEGLTFEKICPNRFFPKSVQERP